LHGHQPSGIFAGNRKKILLPYLRDDDPYFTYRELHRIFRTLDPVEVISAQICRNIKPFEPIAAF